MLYNSFVFLLFFPIVAVVFFVLPHKVRRWYLLIVSYFFYMNWNPTYGLFLAFVTLVSYFGAQMIHKYVSCQDNKRGRSALTSTLLLCFSGLFVFKYLNFFNDSVWSLLSLIGIRMEVAHIELLLPVGISFYTFQACGYVIDVYRQKIVPENNFGTYALFISFFPQIAAGPIGRAKELFPQFKTEHYFNREDITKGLRWMLWGYFMKVVVADRLALYTDAVFGNIAHHTGMSILVAAILFTFQIYCDFAGYSFIALGCARIMGFRLIVNFERPYMATSVQDFWRRWHISLSTWFRDYLYIPLGGSRCSKWRTRINLMITFLVSGLWHGASWTFVIWGGLNGLFQVIGNVMKPVKERVRLYCRLEKGNRWLKAFNILVTFVLMMLAWIFFKAQTLGDEFLTLSKIVIPTGGLYKPDLSVLLYSLMGISVLIVCDVFEERNGRHLLLENRSIFIRFVSYVALSVMILSIGVFDGGQFIYFQF